MTTKKVTTKKVTTAASHDKIDHCPALVTIKAISGKWKTRLLWLLRSGDLRFNDLRRHLNGVSAKVLTDHLRQMEHDGVVVCERTAVGGIQVSRYRFSDYGSTLIPVLDAIGEWGVAHEARLEGMRGVKHRTDSEPS